MEWVNVNFFDTFEAIRTLFLTWLLVPVKRFFCRYPLALGGDCH